MRSTQLPGPPMPSLSPHLIPGPIFTNSSIPVLTQNPLTLVGTLPPASHIFCKSTGCHSTRIRKGCDRWMCKAHCIEAGGCSQPPHKRSQPPKAPASDNMLLPPPPPSLQSLSIPLAPHTASPSPLLINTMPIAAPFYQQIMIDPSLSGQPVSSISRPLPLATRHAGPAFHPTCQTFLPTDG